MSQFHAAQSKAWSRFASHFPLFPIGDTFYTCNKSLLLKTVLYDVIAKDHWENIVPMPKVESNAVFFSTKDWNESKVGRLIYFRFLIDPT